MEPWSSLLAALGDAASRPDALQRIAVRGNARAAILFVADPGVSHLLPAPGTQLTLPSTRGWRPLLQRCTESGLHSGEVAYPTASETASATAYTFSSISLVLVGTTQPDDELVAALRVSSKLLAPLLAAEMQLMAASGELAIAKETAHRVSVLVAALDAARADAERAGRVKDEFLAMLGHELRNPLAPMVTAIQLLRREGAQSKLHDILERQVDHLQRLVDDLLDISRITAGRIELRRQRVETSTIITRSLEQVRPLLESKHTALVLDVPEHGLLVDGDPARLAQVVSNLLVNAAKYSNNGTRIELRATRHQASVKISVTDEGIGIAREDLEKVFGQFFQVGSSLDRSGGGLGLGLAIVRSLVALHDGTVTAESDGPGKGSTFTVELPLAMGRADEVSEQTARVAEPASVPRAQKRVLVVDDNVDAAELLAEVLDIMGYDVRTAHDGPSALRLLSEFPADAAILDIGLPIMDGYELAGLLRKQLPRVATIALTGYGQHADHDRAREAGFDAHLVKPANIPNVQATLARLLGENG